MYFRHSTEANQIYQEFCDACEKQKKVEELITISSDSEEEIEKQLKMKQEPDGVSSTKAESDEPPLKKRRRSEKLSDALWNEENASFVEELPWDINGTTVFKLRYDPKDRFESSKDGRPWKKVYDSDKGM